MGCGCADRMRRLLEARGYELDRPGGTWRHACGSEFTDAYVEKHHARLLARFLADRRVRMGRADPVRSASRGR